MATRTADERLYLDKTRTKIATGRDAAFLWKSVGDEITDDEAQRFGLDAGRASARRSGPPSRGRTPARNAESVDDDTKAASSDENKEAEQGGDKAAEPSEDKSA